MRLLRLLSSYFLKLTMTEEFNIMISKIVSLNNVDAILPNLISQNIEQPCLPSQDQLSLPSQYMDQLSPPSQNMDQPSRTSQVMNQPSRPSLKRKQENLRSSSKNNRKYLGMKAHELRYKLQEDAVKFCQEHGLIAKSVCCECGQQMKLMTRSGVSEGLEWGCSHGKNSRKKQTIRKGTLFENSRLSISDILWIAYMWVHEYSFTSMMHECDHAAKTVIEWCTYYLDLCQGILEHKCVPIGGDQKFVEVFECKFANKTKGKNKNNNQKWVFCALEQFSTNSLLIIVQEKTSDSLLQVFDEFFLPKTTVISHVWCPYKQLSAENFDYLTKEKSLSFYDTVTEREMNTFEEFQKVAIRPPPGLNKWSKLEYGSRFFEYMYRKSLAFAPDAYLAFLKDVSLVYKPCDKLVTSLKESAD